MSKEKFEDSEQLAHQPGSADEGFGDGLSVDKPAPTLQGGTFFTLLFLGLSPGPHTC